MPEDEIYNQEPTVPTPDTEDEGGVPVKQQLFLVGGILVLIFGSTITTGLFSHFNNTEDEQNAAITESLEEIGQPSEPANNFNEVNVVARSAYVFDVKNQRALYKKNETEILPLASVTKLMTALVAHEILDEETSVSVNEQALNQDGDSGLLENEQFKRKTLSDLVLMSSSNDGAYALAISAGNTLNAGGGANTFVDAMNIRAAEIGLNNTTYNNPTGLDISEHEAGAYGTARDMAFLMEYIVKNDPAILEPTTESTSRIYSDNGIYHEAENTNFYIDEIPGLIGSKTGYTDLAGGNLVIAYDAGLDRPVVISVLGSTQTNRFTDVLKLIEATNKYLSE